MSSKHRIAGCRVASSNLQAAGLEGRLSGGLNIIPIAKLSNGQSFEVFVDFDISPAYCEYERLMGAGEAGKPGNIPKVTSPKPYVPKEAVKSAPFWESWGASWNEQSKKLGEGAGSWWKDVSNTKNWKAPKWEMPVHVDVDVLNPIILSVKKSARDVWIRLPPPVQQGLPYVAVGATTGMLVWKIQGGRLKKERTMTDKLQSRVETLLEERNRLQSVVKDLRNRAVAPKSASEMKMAAAVAEATTAAAAAASAAASAASRCSVIVRRPEGKQ